MLRLNERFVIDEHGKRTAVLLDIEAYEALLEALEELEDTRAYDEAKVSNDEVIPFEQAIAELENSAVQAQHPASGAS